MPSVRPNGFSSGFDDMLERNRRDLDSLSGGADLGRSPSSGTTDSATSLPTTQASSRRDTPSDRQRTPSERALDEKLGGRWRYDVMERIRDAGEMVVRCRITVPGRGVTRTQYGAAPMGDGSIQSERGAERQAIESALSACANLF